MKLVKITGMSEIDRDTLLDWTPILILDGNEVIVLESEWAPIDLTEFKDNYIVEYVEV